LIGRQITAIQWEEMEGQALPVLVLALIAVLHLCLGIKTPQNARRAVLE